MAFFKFRLPGRTGPAAADDDTPRPAARRRAAAPTPAETVESLRRRARHRLLGAAVLVAAAIIGFPLLFDTQPRPVAVQAPIDIPDRDTAPPLRIPPAPGNSQVTAGDSLDEREEVVTATERHTARSTPRPAPRAAERAPSEPAATDSRSDRPSRRAEPPAAELPAPRPAPTRAPEPPAPKPAAKPAPKPAEKPAEKPVTRPVEKPTEKPAEKPVDKPAAKPAPRPADSKPARGDDGARARALLEGRAAPARPAADPKPASGSRFVIQIGAFSDEASVRNARQRAERAGVRTYTQVLNTSAGKRTRVRAGPFASREDADKAAAALRKAGLPSAVQSF